MAVSTDSEVPVVDGVTSGSDPTWSREHGVCCVDPTHYPTLVTISRAFPNVGVGPVWWYNDSPFGIDHLLEYAGSVALLANHAGMVSDSRKLLSFDSRFEVFRRSLGSVVGRQIDRRTGPARRGWHLVDHLAPQRAPRGPNTVTVACR